MSQWSSQNAPLISVIVCTVNRAKSLKTTLDYISKLTYPNFELIIVYVGSDTVTVDAIQEFRAQSALDVRMVREDRKGLSFARNRGIEQSSGDIISFTDDDCYVAPDWLDRIAMAFQDQELGFVGGRVLLFDPEDAPITIQLSETRKTYRPGRYVIAGEIHGANMSFRRKVFDKIDGFDTRLGAGQKLCPEDSDALNRAAAAGFSGLYDPGVVVSHHHGRRGNVADAMDKIYARGRGVLMMKILLSRCPWRQKLAPFKPFLGNIKRTPIYIVWESIGALQYFLLWLGDLFDPPLDATGAKAGLNAVIAAPALPTPSVAKPIK